MNGIKSQNSLQNIAVENLRKYLRIPTVQPDVNYAECVDFLKKLAKELDLEARVFEYYRNKPILVITWKGRNPELPSILLNSHMDVVPVYREMWTHDPFEAEMDDAGNIYARGAQDMKSVGIQYLEAIRSLKDKGVVLQRTIHVSFVPDEEIGGLEGMKTFATTDDFKNLNVCFALDEGCPNSGDEFYCFNGERTGWQFRIHCEGATGHGSQLMSDTAGEKVRYVLDKIYDYRQKEFDKLDKKDLMDLGNVTTINVNMLEGGLQLNVVPSELVITVDCRITVTVDLKQWEEMIEGWCRNAGKGVYIEYLQRGSHVPVTQVTDDNKYWVAFNEGLKISGKKITPFIFPAGTDSRYLRKQGIPVIGFSPMHNTDFLVHGHDEYINVDVFLKGIKCYANIITKLGNLPKC